jgi:hypothetical protein
MRGVYSNILAQAITQSSLNDLRMIQTMAYSMIYALSKNNINILRITIFIFTAGLMIYSFIRGVSGFSG